MRILYVCSDLGIPVLGHRGGSIHVRSLVNAFNRARYQKIFPSRSKISSRRENGYLRVEAMIMPSGDSRTCSIYT